MKRITAVLAVLASLVLAPTALAHPNVTGSASQACDGQKVKLVASFSNAGFDDETTVTATDSGGAVLGTQPSPASFEATFNVSDRAAGTVTFNWTAGNDSGTIQADYAAASGCIPPPPPPPPPPTGCTSNCGGLPHIGTPVSKHSPRQASPAEAKAAPKAIRQGELPFSGIETWVLAMLGLGLVGMGLLTRKKTSD